MSYTLSSEAFVEYLIDRGGLVDFVDLQLRGKPRGSWSLEDWREVTLLIWRLSENLWQPTPETVIELHELQRDRHRWWEFREDARLTRSEALRETWKKRALKAEAAAGAERRAVIKRKKSAAA